MVNRYFPSSSLNTEHLNQLFISLESSRTTLKQYDLPLCIKLISIGLLSSISTPTPTLSERSGSSYSGNTSFSSCTRLSVLSVFSSESFIFTSVKLSLGLNDLLRLFAISDDDTFSLTRISSAFFLSSADNSFSFSINFDSKSSLLQSNASFACVTASYPYVIHQIFFDNNRSLMRQNFIRSVIFIWPTNNYTTSSYQCKTSICRASWNSNTNKALYS